MAIKAILFIEPDCNLCDTARKLLDIYLKNGEVEQMDIREGLKKYNLGEPGGVPFIGLISEKTNECISKVYIGPDDEEEHPSNN